MVSINHSNYRCHSVYTWRTVSLHRHCLKHRYRLKVVMSQWFLSSRRWYTRYTTGGTNCAFTLPTILPCLSTRSPSLRMTYMTIYCLSEVCREKRKGHTNFFQGSWKALWPRKDNNSAANKDELLLNKKLLLIARYDGVHLYDCQNKVFLLPDEQGLNSRCWCSPLLICCSSLGIYFFVNLGYIILVPTIWSYKMPSFLGKLRQQDSRHWLTWRSLLYFSLWRTLGFTFW